jgi:hypothetical protein
LIGSYCDGTIARAVLLKLQSPVIPRDRTIVLPTIEKTIEVVTVVVAVPTIATSSKRREDRTRNASLAHGAMPSNSATAALSLLNFHHWNATTETTASTCMTSESI